MEYIIDKKVIKPSIRMSVFPKKIYSNLLVMFITKGKKRKESGHHKMIKSD